MRQMVAAVLLLFGAALVRANEHPRSNLIILEDFSGSLERSSFDEARATISQELPSFVEQMNVGYLEIRTFDVDGWQCHKISDREFPALRLPEIEPATRSEASALRTVREAEEAERKERHAAAVAEITNSYHAQIRRALRSLLPLAGPPPGHESPSSDIVGAFKYAASLDLPGVTYVILISDLADTNVREWPQLPPPKPATEVLVVFVPAKESEMKRTIGKIMPGSQQFDMRVQQVHAAAPWAMIVPHSTRNFADHFGKLAHAKAAN